MSSAECFWLLLLLLPLPRRSCICLGLFLALSVCQQNYPKLWVDFYEIFGTGGPLVKKRWNMKLYLLSAFTIVEYLTKK